MKRQKKGRPVTQNVSFLMQKRESYGGHYVSKVVKSSPLITQTPLKIPAFADYILRKNLARSHHSKSVHINLQSIGIGNGYTDPLTQM
jgi:carboxypeptidase C (cathepsin A)